MRALALGPIALFVLFAGCAGTRHGPTPPPAALHPAPRSAVLGEVDEILAALDTGQVQPIADRMTPRLLDRVGVVGLALAADDLAERHGDLLGIMEERMDREGDLRWYSALVIFGRGRGPRRVLTPVLVQLALDSTDRIERLLVREHVFVETLDPPATGYVPVTRLHVPARGPWRVTQGGPTRELNAHHGSTTQRFAYDLVRYVDDRFRDPALPRDTNEAYYGYGEPLLAPAAGTVVRVVEGVPDNEPGVMGEAGGNGVVIDHGFGEVSSLWHARPGSVRVAEGDRVEAGQVIAEVGNSGRSSGPHIHLHLTRGDGELALPAPFVDLWIDGRAEDLAAPIKGQTAESRAEPAPPELAAGPRVFVDV